MVPELRQSTEPCDHPTMTPDAISQPDDPAHAEASLPETFGQKFRRWFLRASIAGLLLSFAVHIVILLVAGLIHFGSGGGAPQVGPAIEFAVMSQSDLDEMQAEELEVEEPNSQELLDEIVEPSTDPLLDDSLAELTDTQATLDADLNLGGGDLSSADGGGADGGAGTGSASFFGIEARGNRFAYIVDVSGSMGRDGRIEAMRDELTRSISSMPDYVSFFIVLYSDDAHPLGGKRRWTDASGPGKRWARKAIANIAPLGATKPMPAFEMIFDMRPRPDAIYFMTDGEFAEGIADQIIMRNREHPTPIHCITFMSRSAEPVMQRIARETGGTYTHQDGKGP